MTSEQKDRYLHLGTYIIYGILDHFMVHQKGSLKFTKLKEQNLGYYILVTMPLASTFKVSTST